MSHDMSGPYTAFAGPRHIASGELPQVVLTAKEAIDRGEREPIAILDDESGRLVEIDFRGTADDVLRRLNARHPQQETTGTETPAPRGPGRPKLGVVAREVTLLPRHWDWLNSQPGGASVALRKLVEDARRANQTKDRRRDAQEALYRFMSTMAGDEPGFEEASRCLFAGNRAGFIAAIRPWPKDIGAHAEKLSAGAFGEAGS